MSSYLGRHARLYDVFYADKPYSAEAEFMDRRFRILGARAPGDLLELACGTGRHAVEFERLGYNVVAGDYSDDMLAVARARARAAGSRVRFDRLDMRSLAWKSAFDVAVCMFDSIGYVRTDEAVKTALSRVHAALRNGGIFGFEFWHAPPMLRSFDPVRVRRFVTPEAKVMRISETTLDPATRTCTVAYDIFEFFPDGRFVNTQEQQTNRFFDVDEIQRLLHSAGFEPVAFHPSFSTSETVDDSTWHVVAFARKP